MVQYKGHTIITNQLTIDQPPTPLYQVLVVGNIINNLSSPHSFDCAVLHSFFMKKIQMSLL
jgi:hypothetical protein